MNCEVSSSRATDHPMNPPSPFPLPLSGTAVDTEVDTALSGLVSDSAATGIDVPSSLLCALELVRSWLPYVRIVAALR